MSLSKFRGSRFGTFVTAAVLLVAFPLITIQGKPGGNTANIAAAKATFQAKCAMCHGADGAGSEVGKSMNVPDLRSEAVRNLPEAGLAEVIANGKNGMPSFKGSLNAGQIHDIVAYIRTLAAKK
jgi:cytochrome c6